MTNQTNNDTTSQTVFNTEQDQAASGEPIVVNRAKSGAITEQKVIIAGGGHVGLSFALLLAAQGIASVIIERNKYPKLSPQEDASRTHYLDSRNTALSRRTVQIYQEIGLWDELQSHACRIDSVQVSEQGSFGFAQLNKEEENVESFGQVMENAWLGRKLLLAVQKSRLIELVDGATVTAVDQTVTSATITYDTYNAKQQTLTANLLVACDGRDSTVRNLLGIGTKDYDYDQTAIVGVVQTDKPHEHVALERFSPSGPLAVLPLTDADGDGNDLMQAGYRRSVVWICKNGEEKQYLQDDALFIATLQQAFGQRAGTFVKAGRRGAYPLTRVLAERQVEGRVVIMGNAAHTLHPVAGQGFNLCMRDAHVLSKMLGNQVLRGEDIGETAMLKAYEHARQKDQKRVIRFCDAVVHGFTHPNPAVKLARNMALIAFNKLPNVKPLVASYAMGLKS
ncbi:FAD-dependent monooxygenase [Psychrobacter sp.]|uniref:FAD-dependent monooxygenase n=1 Tax=Psychrobacter sp. TaxID=56811 RepID=UPI0025D9825B|nr:FAD-dependent monooxygenase [Psychrobacter sp.]